MPDRSVTSRQDICLNHVIYCLIQRLLADPAVVAGFGKTTTILSGLSMLSFTAYVIVKNLCDVDASGLKYIYCNNPGPTNDAGA